MSASTSTSGNSTLANSSSSFASASRCGQDRLQPQRQPGHPRPHSAAICSTGTSIHALLSLAAADQLVDLDRGVVEVSFGQIVEVVVSLAGVQQVAGHHRVEGGAGQGDAGGAEHDHVVLQVLPDLLDRPDSPGSAAGPPAWPAASRWFCPAGARSGRYQPSWSFHANDRPTISAQRGQTLVVSVSTEMRFCRRSSARNAANFSGVSTRRLECSLALAWAGQLPLPPEGPGRASRCPPPRPTSPAERFSPVATDALEASPPGCESRTPRTTPTPAPVGAVQPRGLPIDRHRHVGVQLHQLAAQHAPALVHFMQVLSPRPRRTTRRRA